MQGREKTQCLTIKLWRASGYICPRTVPRFDDSHSRERAEGGAHSRTTDAELGDQVPLGW